jgi:proline dehydrogenase
LVLPGFFRLSHASQEHRQVHFKFCGSCASIIGQGFGNSLGTLHSIPSLLKLSNSPGFANWVTSNESTRRMARRFVAGETLEEALAAAQACNGAGMSATLDYLGENVSTTADAQRARDAYLNIFDRIAQEKLQPHGCDLVVCRTDDGVMRFLIKVRSTGREYDLIKSFFHRDDESISQTEV